MTCILDAQSYGTVDPADQRTEKPPNNLLEDVEESLT